MGNRIWVYAMCALALAASQAAADDNTPWGKGVSEERKAAAQKLLEQGNDLLLQNQYRDALKLYEQAIASWDHPAIRFNMVRALIALDRSVDAADNLDKALAYGAAPLEDNVYREALNYQRLLAQQLPILEVSCTQGGVKVSVDGAEFLACPGTKAKRTTPGSHAIVASKAGYMTKTYDEVLIPGKQHPIDVSLVAVGDAVTRTRWAAWKPWAVAGSGVAVIGAGVLLELAARSNSDKYESYLQTCPAVGCSVGDPHLDLKDRAVTESHFAVASLAVGGAALATGVVLLVMNRPYAYVPEVSHDSAGVAVVGRF